MTHRPRLVLASDHGGFSLKECIKQKLMAQGFSLEDLGCHDEKSVDYPDYAQAVCRNILNQKADLGILICGTGQGMAISANKIPGIRAAVVNDVFSAKMARQHNNAQVLCLGGRVVGQGLASEIVDAFLNAAFEGGRHQNRLDKISKIEKA